MSEKMICFDTTEATRTKHVQIDKIKFGIRPLGSAEFLQLVDKNDKIQQMKKQGVSGKALAELQNEMFPLIEPLFDPQDKFQAWKKEKQGTMGYDVVMLQVVALAMQGVKRTEVEM